MSCNTMSNGQPFATASTLLYIDGVAITEANITTATTIGKAVFYYYEGLTSVKIGSSVTSISAYAFQRCSNLQLVDCSAAIAVPSLGNANAFSYTHSNLKIIVPDSLYDEWIAATNWSNYADRIQAISLAYTLNSDNASYSVSGIGTVTNTDIVIPATYKGLPVTKISNSAFKDNTSITSVTIPNSVTTIGTYTFQNCSGLTSITIPEGVTTINERVFYGCSGLTSVTIPNSVTTIGTYTFQNCSSLTSITIPAGVTSIGKSAFRGCSGLTSITIPEGVTSIGYDAFRSCSKLTSVTVLSETPPSLTSSAFSNASSTFIIYVPANSVDTYKSATNWSNYGSRIQAIQ